MVDIRQNKNYAEYLKRQNWIVKEQNGIFCFIKKILFFSLLKIQRPKKINYEVVKRLSKKHRALCVAIEPNTQKEVEELLKNGWKQASPYIPSKTIIIDLQKGNKAIFDSFHKNTRYSIRKSEKVKVYEEKDLEKFRIYWKTSVDYKRHVLSLKQLKDLREVFGKDSLFLVADRGISGGIFLVAGDIGYYWYGFVSEEGRKKISQYKLVWESIKWAKERGAKYFDMEGIYDPRFPLKTWKGFTKFKLGFGGKIVKFPGAYRKFYTHSFDIMGGWSN